ncbi:Y-family DNA polymerase [Legionella sainthelensi]|uniref:Y-family DNA polymerase n=1 Tax=Legionella sainthelensi TaxID=28087 RepID=UPI000E2090BB|nr:Y-family DNA polymerase [Legionella sainthelensi]
MSSLNMFALVDCNNFYASCERLFRPDLKNIPIIVLSNNDGCCIARSSEAKALGIAMGEPYFKIKRLCVQHGVKVFSSNYPLYGNISQRVMCIIEETWPHVEIYSIDEAFLDLRSLPCSPDLFCQELQRKILKHTGIPTSIGIGATKTLAKIANYLCKKNYNTPVFNITSHREQLLKQISVGDIWGVGRQWEKKLISRGIYTAYDLATTNIHLLRNCFNVVLMRTAMELQEIACGNIEEVESKQSIISSKSFGQMQTQLPSIAESVSSHCARAVEKMHRQQLVAQRISVFVHTNRFRRDLAQHVQSVEFCFINPTDDLRVITKSAKQCLHRIFKAGNYYKKAGVCLSSLVPKNQRQLDMFHQPNDEQLYNSERLMDVFDQINQKYGRSTIRLAAEGYSKPWAMRAELKSPAYTTRWSDIPRVRLY